MLWYVAKQAKPVFPRFHFAYKLSLFIKALTKPCIEK